jgi:signal transduction histidine kinase
MFGKQSIDYMSVMLEDLLTVSRLDAGKKVITCEAIDLKEMVDSVLERLKLQASQKRIAIANNCTGFISADKKNIEKLFMNCIGNAINYIGGNPDPRIFIGSRFLSDSRMYECIINDNGTGISADIQEEIFQKFKRGKNVSGIQGTGLGLAIAKSVVEMHGGKIWLKSKEGEGTTLYFTLPEDTNPR